MIQEQISTENGDTRTSEYGGEMHRTGHCDAAKRRRCPWASGPASRAVLLVLELRPPPFPLSQGSLLDGQLYGAGGVGSPGAGAWEPNPSACR